MDGPSRPQRALVLGALGLLLLGGLAEVEAWPMTAWRLFSQARGPEQAGWTILAVDASGERTPVRLGDLPLGYRMAGWALGDLPRPPSSEGDALCHALLDQVARERPGTAGLEVLRTRRRLVERDGDWWSVSVSEGDVLACAAGDPP